MKIEKNFIENDIYDLCILGLGYESRCTHIDFSLKLKAKNKIVIGYDKHTEILTYPTNKEYFSNTSAIIIENNDDNIFDLLEEKLNFYINDTSVKVFLDITVMSRYRLSTIIEIIINKLPAGSLLNIAYSLSNYTPPPMQSTPIRTISNLSKKSLGPIGDLSLPSSVIIGLGYEKDKAIGVLNYIDTSITFPLIPISPITKFEDDVAMNNKSLLDVIPKDNIFKYSVDSPYSTYVTLRDLILELKTVSRPLIIPLGPKILSALSIILCIEIGVSAWRVSSDYEEDPIDRIASGEIIKFTVQL